MIEQRFKEVIGFDAKEITGSVLGMTKEDAEEFLYSTLIESFGKYLRGGYVVAVEDMQKSGDNLLKSIYTEV